MDTVEFKLWVSTYSQLFDKGLSDWNLAEFLHENIYLHWLYLAQLAVSATIWILVAAGSSDVVSSSLDSEESVSVPEYSGITSCFLGRWIVVSCPLPMDSTSELKYNQVNVSQLLQ